MMPMVCSAFYVYGLFHAKGDSMKKTIFSVVFALFALCFSGRPVFAEGPGAFSIGAMGGGVAPIASEAVEGFPDTEWDTKGVFAGSLLYRFPSGFAIELLGESLDMELKENGASFGTLKMKPIMLLFKFQGMPVQESGWAGHGGIGGGINNTSFEKGTVLTDLERASGATINITTDKAFVFELGGGADYFFNRHVSVNFDLKMLLCNVGTNWSVSGGGGSATIPDINKFMVSNIQALAGLRVWFGR